jgi:small subunit ribosomal protein S1
MNNDRINEEEEKEDREEKEESFAEMFEAYAAGMNEDLRVGDKIRARIVAVGEDAVFVDTGTKADGVVEIDELKDEQGHFPYRVGDEIDLYVISADENEIRLSRAIAGVGGLNMLKEAQAGAIPVEGKVIQTVKGGFQIEILKRRAFCPISQIDTAYVDQPEAYVGQTFQFLIKKLTEGGRNIVVSRRELLEAEQEQARKVFMQTLEIDQVFTGRVTRLMPYGAFVELVPGVEGMVHISELSWSRLEKPEEAVKPGDKIQVKVLRIEPGKKQKKIALSVKQVLGDPWSRIDQEFQPGQKITGKITRCAAFGAFVELRPGIEGLVHISEMSYTQRVVKPDDIVQAGQSVSVVVKEIDRGRRRISLSIRDAEGDPWSAIQEKYRTGQVVEGRVENRENFGLFVSLEPGVTGLLPKSEINRGPAGQVDKLKTGDTIAVIIDAIQPTERKISLKLRDTLDEDNWRDFSDGATESDKVGDLGVKLSRALKNKPGE